MTPQELDAHIASLGMALADAHAHGDTEGARAKLAEMHAAIRSRTPEHQAAIEAGIQARIAQDSCYFCAMGEADRARLARGEAVLDFTHAVTSGKAGLSLVPFDGQIQTDHQLQQLARLGIVT